MASAEASLEMIRNALAGAQGPAYDMVAINAGATIYAADRTESLALGVKEARRVLDSGEALKKLEEMAQFTQQFQPEDPLTERGEGGMQTMFVEVKCALGESYRVAEALVEIEGVSEVYSISGSYDLLIKCYLAAEEDIGHFVNERIQKVAGITGTMTTIAFNAFS